MDTLMALQNLAVTVKGLKESVDLQATRVTATSSDNIHAASKYHSTFGQLLYKYSEFANQYTMELENLHKALLTDISLKQQEREREFQEKLEILSNKSSGSNLEIVENVQANSVNTTNVSLSSLYSAPNSENSQNTVSIDLSIDAISSEPQPMKSKKSIPISQPKQAPASNHRNKNTKKKKSNTKKSNGRNNKSQKSTNNMNQPSVLPKMNAKPASKKLMVKNVTKRKEEQKNDELQKYVYDADRVDFNLKFDVYDKVSKGWITFNKKEYKHTTMIFVGNIPLNIKTAAVQYFVMKKFKVTMRQIAETKLQRANSGFTQYALVRFRNDVPMDHITKYMNILNSENARIKEEKIAAKDAFNVITKKKSSKKDKDSKDDNKKNKKQGKTSWQYRVFVNLSKPEYHYSYYQNEQEMYNEKNRNHELFIRNFDIVNKKCHKELTDTLLQFGDLHQDIQIKVDVFGDPYCIAIFKYINDAVYCCNSDIYFGGKRLDIRYSRN